MQTLSGEEVLPKKRNSKERSRIKRWRPKSTIPALSESRCWTLQLYKPMHLPSSFSQFELPESKKLIQGVPIVTVTINILTLGSWSSLITISSSGRGCIKTGFHWPATLLKEKSPKVYQNKTTHFVRIWVGKASSVNSYNQPLFNSITE